MSKIAGIVGGAALVVCGLGATASASTPPPPDPAADFTTWAAANGLSLSNVACHVAELTTCYGLDPTMTTVTATSNADGTFTLVVPTGGPAPASAAVVDPSGGVGTRVNPVPIGTPADVGDGWTLVVNSVNLDATDLVTGENMFNDPPPEGSVYVMINVTATYNGPDEKATPFIFMSGVTSANVEYDGLESFVVAPDSFDMTGDVFAGGSATGNTVLTIPAAEIPTLVLYTSAGFGNDDVYFAAQ